MVLSNDLGGLRFGGGGWTFVFRLGVVSDPTVWAGELPCAN